MNPCGHYRIYSGECRANGEIEVGLEDVNQKGRTLTIVLSRDFGPIRIGAELEIVSFGQAGAQHPEGFAGLPYDQQAR
jgi:hypothetical protein